MRDGRKENSIQSKRASGGSDDYFRLAGTGSAGSGHVRVYRRPSPRSAHYLRVWLGWVGDRPDSRPRVMAMTYLVTNIGLAVGSLIGFICALVVWL
mgnify:CR=1 FL=1